MIVIRDPKTFYFDFDCAEDVDDNLKHDIELIIKGNESLVKSNITNELEQLLLKSDFHLPKKYVICFIESYLKMMKNTFYFILKALFVIKIFKFLA